MGLPDVVLQARDHAKASDIHQANGNADAQPNGQSSATNHRPEPLTARVQRFDHQEDGRTKEQVANEKQSVEEGQKHLFGPRHENSLTHPTNDVPPSQSLPSSANPNLDLPSERPSLVGLESAPELPTLQLPEGEDEMKDGLAEGGRSEEGSGKGKLDEKTVQELKHDLTKAGHRPIDNLHQSNGGDYLANQEFVGLQTLAGGGKGVRHASFQSMLGQNAQLVDEPDSLPPSPSQNGKGDVSDKQHANSKLLAFLRPKSKSQDDSGVPPASSSDAPGPSYQAEEQAAGRKHHEPLTTSQPLPPLLKSHNPLAAQVGDKKPLNRSLSAPVSPQGSPPKIPSVPIPRAPLAATSHQMGMVRSDTAQTSKWSHLKSKLQRLGTSVPAPREEEEEPKEEKTRDVHMVDELLTGQMAVGMIRMIMERDEKGRGRVPVFLHYVQCVPAHLPLSCPALD